MTVGLQRSAVSQPELRERAELVLAQLEQLPTLSPVVARLLALTGDDAASIRDLIRVIESDASLTACILRLVRRADLGVRADGMTVTRAVPLLGFRLVRGAAISCPFFEALRGPGRDAQAAVRRRDLWRHSLAVACAAELLAEHSGGRVDSASAFLAGLLHDVGKIALDVCFPKSFARAWERATSERMGMCDAEAEVLGIDHTAAGKRLASRWGLERRIIDAIWLHHQDPDSIPSGASDAALIRLVQLADAMARRAGLGSSGSRQFTDVDELAERSSVEAADLAKVSDTLPKRLSALCESLGLEGDEADREEWIESLQRAHGDLARSHAQLADQHGLLLRRCAVLDAIAALNRRLTEHDRVADVCAAAAGALRRLWEAQAVLVSVSLRPSTLAHVGWDDGESGHALVVDGGDPAAGEPSELPTTRATVEQGEYWRRCTGAAADSLFVTSFAADAFFATVMLSIDEPGLRRGQPAAEDWAALLDAIRRAIGSAWSRSEAVKTAEELLALNRRLHAAQYELARRRSIGMIAQMAAGAAHELNNPLAVISGRAQMELGSHPESPQARSLEIIVEQAQRASDIVSELMRFAKPEDPQPGLLPLAESLPTVCRQWSELVGVENSVVTIRVGEGATTAYADDGHLREILRIVLSNALEATDPARRAIQVNSVRGASDEIVRIRIEDNGVGLAPEVLEHAFDPFYSSRPAGRGRGLGLSRAYRLAEINGGRLWIDSTPGIATTVTIELPTRAAQR